MGKKKFTKEQEEKIAKKMIEISVFARTAQHLMWEIQYCINAITDEGVDMSVTEKYKNQAFNYARNVSDSLIKRYDENIDSDDRPEGWSRKHPILRVYDDTSRLHDIDDIIREKTKKLYDENKLVFRDFSDENDSELNEEEE